MIIAWLLAALAAAAWAYLLSAHGGFWRADLRLPSAPPAGGGPARWPAVAAVIPARDEAAMLPVTLPGLLGQDYPGSFAVTLVDDGSTDGTAAAAAAAGRAAGWAVRTVPAGTDPAGTDRVGTGPAGTDRVGTGPAGTDRVGTGPAGTDQVGSNSAGPADRVLTIVPAAPPPPGWAGKVWAMHSGLAAGDPADYVLFTDADIGFASGSLVALVRAAAASGCALVSQMALLRTQSRWERLLVPAFVYFFAQLYPFRWVNRAGRRTAAAAGGCMLVRAEALAAAGGLAAIGGARIDDVALARLLKRRARATCWLGLSTEITSRRPYPRLADLWAMVTRSAYTQLRYSPVLLALTIAGLSWLYLLPPAAFLAGLAAAAAGGGAAALLLALLGLAGWCLMTASYLPMLRLYRLSPLRAPALPLVAAMYAAMTADSARRYWLGRGAQWKGRTVAPGSPDGTT
jgi:hopene-associated glycosyltransferase HpnB